MNSYLKHLIAMLLALTMALSLFNGTVWAAEEDLPADGSDSSISVVEENPITVSLSENTLTLFTGKSATLKATVQPEGEHTVQWSSDNKKVATVDSMGKVIAKGAGNCTITATVDDVTATCVVTVKKPTIKLDYSTLRLVVKGTKNFTLKATVVGPSKKVTWKSNNTKVATVDKKGKVTIKKTGKCTITATANGVSAKCKIRVVSEKQQALEEYADALSQPYAFGSAKQFAIAYMDDDSVPELIIKRKISDNWVVDIIKCKKNGLLVYWEWEDGTDIHYYKKKAYFVVSDPLEMKCYYNLRSTGQAFLYLTKDRYSACESFAKYGTSSTISKSKFDKLLKKKVGSTKPSKPSFHKNNKSNRKKYLK